MADNQAKYPDMAENLMRFLNVGDFTGAERFLCGIDEQDKKMIFANNMEVNAMLFAAAGVGYTAMVEFLVKVCQADIEEVGQLTVVIR